MHADLKREPRTKPEVPGEGVESVTAQVWVKPPKEKRTGKKENNKKPLPLPSTLKATNGTMMKIMVIVTCHIHLESGRPCGVESAKGTRRKTTTQVIQ